MGIGSWFPATNDFQGGSFAVPLLRGCKIAEARIEAKREAGNCADQREHPSGIRTGLNANLRVRRSYFGKKIARNPKNDP